MFRRGWIHDQIGKKFGLLTVIRSERECGNIGETLARVKCECGVEKLIPPHALRRGAHKSCGCHRGSPTHGMSRTPEFFIWDQMRRRCVKSNHPEFKNYGARGIEVCERWQKFENFLADMGPRPSSSHSIDRYPNNDGNYEPGNCRWATLLEQNNNTRRNKFITHNGETLTATQWARKLDVPVSRLLHRLKAGLPPEVIFSRSRAPSPLKGVRISEAARKARAKTLSASHKAAISAALRRANP